MTKKYEPKYWNEEGEYQKLYDKYHKKLVPSCGASNTLEGEILRCVSRLYYEIYNNGRNCNCRKMELSTLNKYRQLFGFNKNVSKSLSDKNMDLLVDKIVLWIQKRVKTNWERYYYLKVILPSIEEVRE